MKKFYFIFSSFLSLVCLNNVFAQTATITDYDFNASNTTPVSTAAGVTSSGSSDQAISYNGGVASGGSAFTANGTAGQDMSITSGNVATHYFQFQLGGANLNTYCCYKLYFQIKSSATGATVATIKYSTDGSTYTTYTTVAITTSFVEQVVDLCSVTAINNQTAVYFQINTSGGSGAGGTTAIDNFEVQADNSSCSGTSYTYPVLTGIVVDGCNSYSGSTPSCATTFDNTNCTEGRSEIAFFRNGTTAITSAQVQAMTRHVIDYYTTAWSVLTYYTGVSMNNAATTTALNTSGCSAGSCGSCFIDAWSGGIPANASFIMVADYYCIGSTDYTNLCSNSSTNPIYVIYFGASTNNSNNCNGGTTGVWDVSGNYTNYSGTATVKGIAIDMSSLVAGAPVQYYTYNINSLANCSGVADGAGIAFSGVSTTTATPTTPNAYTSCACTLTTLLPIDLLNFSAVKAGENTQLNWTTATETDNNYFMVEYSFEGENFIPYKEVKGAGNSDQEKKYSCLFTLDSENQGVYFRLKQVDYNGNYKYSNVITLSETETSSVNSYYNSGIGKIVTKVHSDKQKEIVINLYDVSGKKIAETYAQLIDGDNQILINAPDNAGVYFLTYTGNDQLPVHKKIFISK